MHLQYDAVYVYILSFKECVYIIHNKPDNKKMSVSRNADDLKFNIAIITLHVQSIKTF